MSFFPLHFLRYVYWWFIGQQRGLWKIIRFCKTIPFWDQFWWFSDRTCFR